MTRYKPGSSFRTSAVITVLGVLTDPSSPTAVMRLPDGTTTSSTPVRDSLGMRHADFLIPLNTPPGVGYYRWQSTGGAVQQNDLAEVRFEVQPLDFT
jgi:hypothetical protein